MELLRLCLREIIPLTPPEVPTAGKQKPPLELRECTCVHTKKGYLPPGVVPCMSAGTRDAGKANGFVIFAFRKRVREWLDAQVKLDARAQAKKEEYDGERSDTESEEDSDGDTLLEPPPLPSSYKSSGFPTSPGVDRSKATKQRLGVLHYLVNHSDSLVEFQTAFIELCDPGLELVHLCGCGIDGPTLVGGTCVVGSHLKLALRNLNAEHKHYHFVLHAAPTTEAYQSLVKSIQGSQDGRFDDVF
ncbi:hypothetical protein C8J57DRAFT_1530244 [Mycena rebaudengoi]|nr:hypothetical protein C8J57DRAFT_1530244 [Mycena rebaudengoi]